MRRFKLLIYTYLVIGLAFGLALFGWGALVASMAEPETPIFIKSLAEAALDGALRIANWAPSLTKNVLLDGKNFFEWMLYT
jgi:hypothetical protein